ncbi:hypothetical protein X992_4183 [Burkholderia pseudomallei MSHR5492]|nr:hypothetical protein X992_4183 [Burkholderia pseudomallei MSHR5492]
MESDGRIPGCLKSIGEQNHFLSMRYHRISLLNFFRRYTCASQ